MKKLFPLVLAILIIIQADVLPQSCLPEGKSFQTQAEIDNFQTDYPGCTRIIGSVGISTSNITSLSGLSVLTAIESGDLTITGCSYLNSLTGLDNLGSIGASLEISACNTLVDLSGLGGLVEIGGHLYIHHNRKLISFEGLIVFNIGHDVVIQSNDDLENINGLENVTMIAGNLRVESHPKLKNLNGLANINSVQGKLRLTNNTALINLGFQNISYIGDELYIYMSYVLNSLAGLENMNHTGGPIEITRNNRLANVDALSNVTSIGGNLIVNDNHNLTSISGISNIDPASIDNLNIVYNPLLSICDEESICNYLASPTGNFDIHDNAQGCNSPLEVTEMCGTPVQEHSEISNIILYPNPFNKTATIDFELQRHGVVNITFFNNFGKNVETIVDEKLNPGNHQFRWNPEHLPAGIYSCVIKAQDELKTIKVVRL